MSVVEPAAPAAPVVVPPAAPAPSVPAAPPATPAPAVDPFDDPTIDKFERSYVEKLRQEAGDRRVALKPYEEAFGHYDAADQAVWFELAKAVIADPKAGAAQMRQIADALIGEAPVGTAPVAPAADEGEPLTRAEIEKMLGERDTQRQKAEADARELDALFTEASQLGYAKDDWRTTRLFLVAQKQTGGDLKKAHDVLEAESQADRQKIIDDYVNGRRQDAGGSPSAGGTTGGAPSQGGAPKDFESARASLEERVKAAVG